MFFCRIQPAVICGKQWQIRPDSSTLLGEKIEVIKVSLSTFVCMCVRVCAYFLCFVNILLYCRSILNEANRRRSNKVSQCWLTRFHKYRRSVQLCIVSNIHTGTHSLLWLSQSSDRARKGAHLLNQTSIEFPVKKLPDEEVRQVCKRKWILFYKAWSAHKISS